MFCAVRDVAAVSGRYAAVRGTVRGRNAVVAVVTTVVAACFGSRDFGDARRTAVRFAEALHAGDTVAMRSLSMPEAGTHMVQLRSELPPAYLVFGDPLHSIRTVSGGGVYGSGAQTVFRIPSARLGSCDGGLDIAVIKVGGEQRVSFVRPDPPIDSVSDDACRAAIADTASARRP
jgi:hypothetical protein